MIWYGTDIVPVVLVVVVRGDVAKKKVQCAIIIHQEQASSVQVRLSGVPFSSYSMGFACLIVTPKFLPAFGLQ